MKRTNENTFFRELATLIEAGIDLREAILQLNPKPRKQWLSVAQQLQQGDAFHRVLAGKNLLSRYEKEILEVSESAGRLNEGLRFLADSHESRRLRLSKLRSKLAYPFLVLTAAIVVSALFTALHNPGIPVFSILSTAMLWFLFAVFLTKLLRFTNGRQDSTICSLFLLCYR